MPFLALPSAEFLKLMQIQLIGQILLIVQMPHAASSPPKLGGVRGWCVTHVSMSPRAKIFKLMQIQLIAQIFYLAD